MVNTEREMQESSCDRLEAVAALARRLGAHAACYSIDLATESGQIEVTRKLQCDLSSVDILVQNAATFMAGPLEQAKLEDLDALYRTNVRAAFAQALLPMLKARRGQIVFVHSGSGIIAKPNSASYDATKHALKAIADSLRGRLASRSQTRALLGS